MSLAKKRAALSEKTALLKTKGDRLKELAGKDDISAAEVTEMKALTGEVTTLRTEADALVAEIKDIEEAIKASEIQIPATTATEKAARKADVQVRSTDGVLKVGLVMAGLAAVKGGYYDDVGSALFENGYGNVADELALGTKQLQATGGTGGLTVPPSMSSDIIEFLRPTTTFLRLQPRIVPMVNGTFTQAGGNTGGSASYGPENSVPPYSEATFRDINMSVKDLKAKTAISNKLLMFGLPQVRQFIETDLRDVCAETMDLNAFLGDGLQSRPLGIYNIPGIGSTTAVNSTTPTIAQVEADLRWAVNYLATRNVSLSTAKWTMSYQTFGYLQDMRDGNGNFYFPTLQQANPTLKGFPVLVTTNLPTNLGAGSNESHLSLIASTHVYFGEQPGLRVKVSDEAAYTDASGNLRSAAEREETVMFMFQGHDFALRHLPAVAVLTGVKWGR